MKLSVAEFRMKFNWNTVFALKVIKIALAIDK